MSQLEKTLAMQLSAMALPPAESEYRFAAMATGGTGKGVRARLAEAGLRDWRFDFAWPELFFAVEVEGGAYVGGRHNRGSGFENDLVKYHHAMRLGWTVYRCSAHLIKTGEAAQLVAEVVKLNAREAAARAEISAISA